MVEIIIYVNKKYIYTYMRWQGKAAAAFLVGWAGGPYGLAAFCGLVYVAALATGMKFTFFMDMIVSELESLVMFWIPWSVPKLEKGPEDAPLRGINLPEQQKGHKDKPVGEVIVYSSKESDKAYYNKRLPQLREAAKIHYTIRKAMQKKIKIGMSTIEIVETIDRSVKEQCKIDSVTSRKGSAFPVGVNLNEVAAHHTPNPGDPLRYLEYGDVTSLDFGVHIDGNLVDCAFSFAFDPRHDGLLETVKAATNEGLKHVGIDARVAEIGSHINEVMEAGEVFWPNGKVWRVKTIKNLTGHLIEPYTIHAGKSLPVSDTGENTKMLEGELWALETFGSYNGVGYVRSRGPCSHFMFKGKDVIKGFNQTRFATKGADMLKMIDRRFSTLAFCPRWFPLDWMAGDRWKNTLSSLVHGGIVNEYPPLCDIRGSYTAQYEHTVFIRPNATEILTRGEDY
eukprot:GEMP01049834.1.p1 GENE.GEMP01049834.1~~GEMP01049834.1.p1  ORF type:complete len:452 (+),score=62.69 GEMP01049834.1:193-1548(+)